MVQQDCGMHEADENQNLQKLAAAVQLLPAHPTSSTAGQGTLRMMSRSIWRQSVGAVGGMCGRPHRALHTSHRRLAAMPFCARSCACQLARHCVCT